MIYIGAAVLISGVVLVSRVFRDYLLWQIELLDGFIAFIKKMNTHASSYLEPIKGWIFEFECTPLEEIGLLPALRDGKMPKEAYRGLKTHPSSPEAHRALLSFFDRTGTGYISEELVAQERCLAELTKIAEGARSDAPKRARAFSALLFALVGGGVILLL